MGVARSGRCACGAIRFTTSADPLVVMNCHCRDCQRASGTAFSTIAVFPAVALTVEGNPKWHETTADSGAAVRRAFCTECGCPLFSVNPALAEFAVVKVASFDEPSALAPTVDIWTASALPWVVMDPRTRKVETNLGG